MKKIKNIDLGLRNLDAIKFAVEKNYSDLINDYKDEYKKKDIKKSFIAQRLFARFLSFRTLNQEILNLSNILSLQFFSAHFCLNLLCLSL